MTISKRTRFSVLNRDNFTCRYCGRHASVVELHVDHVHPRALGGSDDLDNLVTACVDCNLGKGTLPLYMVPEVVSGSHAGEWFHILDVDGEINYQGQVIRDLGDGRLDVQLYDWIIGGPSDRKTIGPLPDDQICFYSTDEAMRRAYARAIGVPVADTEWEEEVRRGIDRRRSRGSR